MKKENEISEQDWREIITPIYESLPSKQKTYANRTMFQSIALDAVLRSDISSSHGDASRVLNRLYEIYDADANNVPNLLASLKGDLDAYYHNRMDDGRYEKSVFGKLRNKPYCAMFILSYNRPNVNATLKMMESWDDEEVYQNTFVFVQSDQKAEYEKHHPKFYFYAHDVNSVGERFGAVVDFCKHYGISHAIILEDDIAQIRHIKKGGVDSGSHLATREEDLGGVYLKYIAYKGREIMKRYKDVIMVGVRNRVMANNESTSVVGYHEPMKGGCPNMIHFIDVERFYPVWKKIPKEHYTPQSDWAIQCATVSSGKKWAMITGIVKDENNSKSVIGFTGDREALAAEYIKFYNVQDSMTYRRFKDTAMQGVKIFYNSRKEKTDYEKLF